ncbi:cyclophilin-like fold protein [Achromobacter xylosoxidans]
MLKTKMLAMTLMAALPMSVMAAEGGGSSRGIKVKVTAGKHVLTATFIDNATTRALVVKFPLTVPMMDLYSRELVYRFPEPLPANETRTSGYEVGDIVYWAPRHSFVIMYAQNGERISDLQKVGRIDAGLEVLGTTGNTNVRFELLKD